jgi:hypothetical protein
MAKLCIASEYSVTRKIILRNSGAYVNSNFYLSMCTKCVIHNLKMRRSIIKYNLFLSKLYNFFKLNKKWYSICFHIYIYILHGLKNVGLRKSVKVRSF